MLTDEKEGDDRAEVLLNSEYFFQKPLEARKAIFKSCKDDLSAKNTLETAEERYQFDIFA